MNDRKICFISCVSDSIEYRKSLRYILSLQVPEGYEIEMVSIEQAGSMTAGYNQAMKKSNAKYKVYLHQDVYIINPNFLFDVIELFVKYPALGMIGVAGAKTIPENGIWWESSDIYGTVYDSHTGQMGLLTFFDVKNDYEKVRAVDGLIMVTQYDLSWREDLFQGWHFYDLSQSLEFIKAGYEVGIPKQKYPWCIHDCGIVSLHGYEENRKIFIQNYHDWIGSK